MVRLELHRFDALDVLRSYQEQLPVARYGAQSFFIGYMRDFNDGHAVDSMLLEHYPQMTEHLLTTLVEKAKQQFRVGEILLMHRIGRIVHGDAIVLISVWSEHRREAINCSSYLIERLKREATFWKKEQRSDGSSCWVESSTEIEPTSTT